MEPTASSQPLYTALLRLSAMGMEHLNWLHRLCYIER